MQPYLFAYIGYFQLIHACDAFIYYDDVCFIKGGWINRNRILLRGKPHRFSIPLSGASSNELIKDIQLTPDPRWSTDFAATLYQAYRRAPYFDGVAHLVDSVFARQYTHIADLAICSIEAVCDYLGMPVAGHRSSVLAPQTRGLSRSDRLIAITHMLGGRTYINPVGGTSLYSRDYFAERRVCLQFLEASTGHYSQLAGASFVPDLSIIDVLMFNSVEQVHELLDRCTIT